MEAGERGPGARRRPPLWLWRWLLLLALATPGCMGEVRSTTTERGADEQLLTSTAAARAVGGLDPTPLSGRTVYLDGGRLRSVDRSYVESAFAELLAAGGAYPVRTPAEAEVIVEVRMGGHGCFDGSWTVWVPLSYLAVQVGRPTDAPQVLDVGYKLQEGWARVRAFAYDRRTGAMVHGWDESWGYAYVGFFDDIYPEATLGEAVEERTR